jgi:hypothetical protein
MISLWPSPPTDTFPLLQELLNDVPANVTDATDGEVRIQYPDMSCCVCNTWGYLSSSSTSFRVMTHENIIHFFPSFKFGRLPYTQPYNVTLTKSLGSPAGATLGDGNSASTYIGIKIMNATIQHCCTDARCGSTGHQTQRAAARAHGPAHAVQVQLHRPRGSASGNSESSHTVSRPVVEPRQAGCKTSTSTASATRQAYIGAASMANNSISSLPSNSTAHHTQAVPIRDSRGRTLRTRTYHHFDTQPG